MTDASPGAPPRRRIPWVLLPAAAGLLYAAVWGLLRHRPSLEGMVPPDAFVTWWYRDLAAYDAARTGPPSTEGAPFAAPSLVLGAQINLPSLAGIDRRRPLVEAWLDPSRRVDPRFWVLPLEDGHLAMRRFRDPDLPERHARHVVPHGDWAAAAWDLDAARTAGRGFGAIAQPSPSETGTTLWSVTADWPRLVDYALRPEVASSPPYEGVLAALGFDPASAVRVETPEGFQFEVKGGRVPLVRDAWSRVTLEVGVGAERREAGAGAPWVRLTLEPSEASPLRALLAQVRTAPPSPGLPRWIHEGTANGGGWDVRFPAGPARGVVARALAHAGLVWPDAVGQDDFAALRPSAPGWLAVGARQAPGVLPAWTFVLAGPPAALPDLGAFGLPDAAAGHRVVLPEGLAVLTMPHGGRPPASEVARMEADDGVHVLAFGIGAEALATQAAREYAGRIGLTPDTRADGLTTLAEVAIAGAVAQRLLRPATEPGGLFAVFADATTVHVDVATDGERLIVTGNRGPERGP